MILDFTAALDGARTLARVDELAGELWRAYHSGAIADADAGRASAQIEEARRRIRPRDTVAVRAPAVPRLRSSFPPRRRRCTSPDRLASRDRRRRLAFSGPLPPSLACRFTVGELAALAVVASEVRATGACALSLCAIAARAGVCVTLARTAIRLAAGDGLAVIVERRQRCGPNQTNIVRIISREWLAWIWRGGGCRKANPTDNQILTKRRSAQREACGAPTAQHSALKSRFAAGGPAPLRL
jgi:hypothetical protein